jgi:hypothetical protein
MKWKLLEAAAISHESGAVSVLYRNHKMLAPDHFRMSAQWAVGFYLPI